MADGAEVSVGTVYIDYGTGDDLLMATVGLEVEEALAAGEAILAAPGGAEMALRRLIWRYDDHSLEYLSMETWWAAMPSSIKAPGATTPDSTPFSPVRSPASSGGSKTRARYGRAPTRALGEVPFNNLNAMSFELATDNGMTPDALKDRLSA